MTEKTDLDKKLDFIVDLLFTICCNTDIHYEDELLEYDIKKAKELGFDVKR